ncbi:hypothetical protein V1522DRAFT_440656 [Lipomyces starkeyi]
MNSGNRINYKLRECAESVGRYPAIRVVYSTILLLVTTIVAVALVPKGVAGKVFGGSLIAAFVLYVGSVLWGISRGRMVAPELSDSDDSSDESETEGESDDTSDIEAAASHGLQDEVTMPPGREMGGTSEAFQLSPLSTNFFPKEETEHNPKNKSSTHTTYMAKAVQANDAPLWDSVRAAFFSWLTLAGYVVFPGTFTSLKSSQTLAASNGGRFIQQK